MTSITSTPTESSSRQQLTRLIVAFLVMLVTASKYSERQIDTENFALGKESQSLAETYAGAPFTASDVRSIIAVLKQQDSDCPDEQAKRVMWLGNSQLHTVNQYRQGEHLAPYWVRASAKKPDCFLPYGLSLPNANFQEYLALTAYVISVTHIDAAVLSLVFDDLREDGLRADFSSMLTQPMRANLVTSAAGQDILARYDLEHARVQEDQDENQGLAGFVQKRFEDSLTSILEETFPLWAERPNLRARVMTDLYYLRNFVLQIKATTIRKLIPARQARNMGALEATLQDLHKQRIPIILYIAPIRQDVPLPYEPAGYARWKVGVSELAARYDAKLLNLETLVPADQWGTYHADDVDFMHFQGNGHHLLAQALLPVLHKAMGVF